MENLSVGEDMIRRGSLGMNRYVWIFPGPSRTATGLFGPYKMDRRSGGIEPLQTIPRFHLSYPGNASACNTANYYPLQIHAGNRGSESGDTIGAPHLNQARPVNEIPGPIAACGDPVV